MAERLESCIGFDKDKEALCVIFGGKIAMRLLISCDKENPHILLDICELEKNVGIGGDCKGVELRYTRFVRLMAYDPESINVLIDQLKEARDILKTIVTPTNKPVEESNDEYDELAKFTDKLAKQFPEVSFAKLSRIVKRTFEFSKEHQLNKQNYEN